MSKWMWVLVCCCAVGTLQAEEAPYEHVVLISVDGLRPSMYLEDSRASSLPFLHKMSKQGLRVRGVKVPYPSQTYPGHATIVTGVWPDRHEVNANTKMDLPEIEGRGYWYQGDIKVPAIWELAHEQGLTTASISWPSTGDAKGLDYVIPEFWSTSYTSEEKNVEKFSDPFSLGVLKMLGGKKWASRLNRPIDRDELLTEVAIEVLEEKKPNLMLLHLRQLDKIQHKQGPRSRMLNASLRRVDKLIKKMDAALHRMARGKPVLMVVVGDHGFASVKYTINLNALFAERGYIKLVDGKVKKWKVLIRNTGGSAGVYFHENTSPRQRRKIREVLGENSELEDGTQLYTIIDREELTELHGPTDADFYLEAITPFMFSGSMRMPFIKRSGILKGNHGYLSTRRAMYTGWVMAGDGIEPADVQSADLTDVAPPIAHALGFEMLDVEGEVLSRSEEKMTESP